MADSPPHSTRGRELQWIEEEYRRLGDDIHDRFSQKLSCAVLAVESLSMQIARERPDISPKIDRLSASLQEVSRELRALTSGLVPHALYEEGLVHALQDLCQQIEASRGIRVAFECEQVLTPAVPDRLSIFRVIQATLDLVAKARPTRLELGVSQRGSGIEVELTHDASIPRLEPSGSFSDVSSDSA